MPSEPENIVNELFDMDIDSQPENNSNVVKETYEDGLSTISNFVKEFSDKLPKAPLSKAEISDDIDTKKDMSDQVKVATTVLDKNILESNIDPSVVTNLEIQGGDDLESSINESKDTSTESTDTRDMGSDEPIIDFSKWNFKSTTPKFDNFYRIKKAYVLEYLGSQPLDIESLEKEVRDIQNIDISNVGFDLDLILDKMTIVCMNLQRLGEIQIIANRHAFVGEGVSRLLQGALALVEYMKPNLRQEGVTIQHLGEVVMYVSGMEALKESASSSHKSLTRSLETLNRRVTVALGEKDISDYNRKGSPFSQDSIDKSVRNNVYDNNIEPKAVVSKPKQPSSSKPAPFMESFAVPNTPLKEKQSKPGSVTLGWD